MGLRACLDEMRALTEIGDEMLLVGGGSKSALWRQIYADIYKVNVIKSNVDQQAAALGAALVAGVGAGVWSDCSVLDSISRADTEAAPDPDAAADYARRYAHWRLLADTLGEWARHCHVG